MEDGKTRRNVIFEGSRCGSWRPIINIVFITDGRLSRAAPADKFSLTSHLENTAKASTFHFTIGRRARRRRMVRRSDGRPPVYRTGRVEYLPTHCSPLLFPLSHRASLDFHSPFHYIFSPTTRFPSFRALFGRSTFTVHSLAFLIRFVPYADTVGPATAPARALFRRGEVAHKRVVASILQSQFQLVGDLRGDILKTDRRARYSLEADSIQRQSRQFAHFDFPLDQRVRIRIPVHA